MAEVVGGEAGVAVGGGRHQAEVHAEVVGEGGGGVAWGPVVAALANGGGVDVEVGVRGVVGEDDVDEDAVAAEQARGRIEGSVGGVLGVGLEAAEVVGGDARGGGDVDADRQDRDVLARWEPVPADFVIGSAEARVDATCLDGSCSAHRGLGAIELAGRAGLVDLTLLRGRRVLRSVRGARLRVGVLCGPNGAGGLLIGAGVCVLGRGVGRLGCGPVGCVAWVGVLWGGALWLWSRAVRCVAQVDVLWSRAVWWWCGVVWGVARVGVMWRGAGRLGCWPVRCVVRVGVPGSRAGRLRTGAVGCVVWVGVLRGRAGVRLTVLRGR